MIDLCLNLKSHYLCEAGFNVNSKWITFTSNGSEQSYTTVYTIKVKHPEQLN